MLGSLCELRSFSCDKQVVCGGRVERLFLSTCHLDVIEDRGASRREGGEALVVKDRSIRTAYARVDWISARSGVSWRVNPPPAKASRRRRSSWPVLTAGKSGAKAQFVEKLYKPQGYSSVSVYIVADGGQRLIDFLTEAFDAKQLRRYDLPDGSIMHAEVQIDDAVVMICDSGERNPSFPVWLHVYVPNVDESYRRLLKAGGTSVQEPMQREGDVDRRGGVKDPVGNTWWIATQVG